jgi:hypothetical protein
MSAKLNKNSNSAQKNEKFLKFIMILNKIKSVWTYINNDLNIMYSLPMALSEPVKAIW